MLYVSNIQLKSIAKYVHLWPTQYGVLIIIQAIFQSSPFGLEYRTAEVERILGIASAAKLFCEYS